MNKISGEIFVIKIIIIKIQKMPQNNKSILDKNNKYIIYIIYMAKKQTIIKKPNGNGNIWITIENNLKNTNPVPPPQPKKRRRRRKPNSDPTDVENTVIEEILRGGQSGGGGSGGGGGDGGGLPPFRDVSYIRPPTNNFTVWWDHMDSYNTRVPIIPEGQTRQMGILPPPTVAAPPNPDNGSMTLRDFAMFMSGNTIMNRNNALQDNIDDDEEISSV